jgi:phosphatidylglycerol:prolipoprotein diacylglycerol transferase
MHPHLFSLPTWFFAALMGGAMGATFAGKGARTAAIGGIAGLILVGIIAYNLSWGRNLLPVQGYGVMILTGYVLAIFLVERQAWQLGIKPGHVLDMALTGCLLGLLGARAFHVAMHWSDFNPFATGTFDASKIAKMFFIWEGGLVFYGAFIVTIPWSYYYCRRHKLPGIPFVDIVAPGLIMGQAFGRIGCFLTGCCYGRVCQLPWAVTFPGPTADVPMGAPAYEAQLRLGQINAAALHSLPVHPSQLYASVAAFLTYGFLYAYWPYRKYDGQMLSLMLMMAGTTRFFEEMLRSDDVPAFPSISASMTVAQWVAIPIVLLGFGMMLYFRRKGKLYRPPPAQSPKISAVSGNKPVPVP